MTLLMSPIFYYLLYSTADLFCSYLMLEQEKHSVILSWAGLANISPRFDAALKKIQKLS